MTFGLPLHLAEHAFVVAVTRASHTVAGVCILAATVILAILQALNLGLILWPAILALVPMAMLLYVLDRRATAPTAAAYLLVGTASVYWYTVTLSAQVTLIATSDAFVLDLAKLALVMVAGPANTIRGRMLWCAAGYAAGEAATQAAVAQTPAIGQFDTPMFVIFLLTQALIAASAFGRRTTRLARPNLHRAARDEQLSRLRTRIETQAAALVHDTVLNSLTAIAASPPGRLDSNLRSQLQGDLELLIGSEWLRDSVVAKDINPDTDTDTDDPTNPDNPTNPTNPANPNAANPNAANPADPRTHPHTAPRAVSEQQRRLRTAIDEGRALGLDIETTGDISTVNRLTIERSTALALAVKQCLSNVARHAETDKAQVAIFGTERDVSVMVIDTGRGFSQADTGSDRLGMRTSVHRRIEAVDGTVQVWSTPGRGTSVMMQVPVTVTHPGERANDQ